MTPFDPAAPAAPPAADTPTSEQLLAQIADLRARLAAQPPGPNTDAAPASAPVPDAAPAPEPVPSTPPPPVGAVVLQRRTAPGDDHEIDLYGIVVVVDRDQNVAQVAWLNATTTVAGAELTQVG